MLSAQLRGLSHAASAEDHFSVPCSIAISVKVFLVERVSGVRCAGFCVCCKCFNLRPNNEIPQTHKPCCDVCAFGMPVWIVLMLFQPLPAPSWVGHVLNDRRCFFKTCKGFVKDHAQFRWFRATYDFNLILLAFFECE